jgi:hypothetical protein
MRTAYAPVLFGLALVVALSPSLAEAATHEVTYREVSFFGYLIFALVAVGIVLALFEGASIIADAIPARHMEVYMTTNNGGPNPPKRSLGGAFGGGNQPPQPPPSQNVQELEQAAKGLEERAKKIDASMTSFAGVVERFTNTMGSLMNAIVDEQKSLRTHVTGLQDDVLNVKREHSELMQEVETAYEDLDESARLFRANVENIRAEEQRTLGAVDNALQAATVVSEKSSTARSRRRRRTPPTPPATPSR